MHLEDLDSTPTPSARTTALDLLMEVCPIPTGSLNNDQLIVAALAAATVDNNQQWAYDDVLAAARILSPYTVARIFMPPVNSFDV